MALSIDELNAMQDNPNWQVAIRRPQAKQQPKKKGFWQDQISTGGGIGGAIAGGIAGAGAGSILPGVGTVIGGLAGAILGGAGGGAAGQYVENGTVGEEDMSKDVLKEGLLNGAFAVGPIRGASIAKALVTGGGREGVERAATSTPIRTAIGQKFGSSLERSGQKLLGTQANLTRADIRKLGPGSAPADVLGTINSSTGLRSLDDMAEVGSNVTGTNGILSELSRNAIGNSRGVDIGDLRTVADELIVNQAPLLSDSARKNVLNQVQNSVVKSYGGSKGSLSTLANPLDAFDAARSFEKMAAKIRTSPTVSPADEQLAGVYSTLAKTMTDRLYAAPGVNEGVQLARQEAVKRFQQLASAAPSKAQKNAYLKLAEQAGQLSDVKSIRSAQSPFVKLGKIEEKTAAAEAGAGMRLTDQAQGLGKLVQKPLNLLALPVEAASPRVAGAMTGLGSKLGSIGRGSSNPTSPMGMASRMGVLGALTSESSYPDAQPTPNEEWSLEDALMAPQSGIEGQLPTEMGNPFGVSREDVAQQMLVALQNGDTKGFGTLKDIYDMIDDYESASGAGGSDLTSQQATAVSKTKTATSALDRLERLYGKAGGGGRLEGTLANALGAVGGNASAKAYNDQLASTARFMGRAMGETGAGSDADAQAFISRLPQLTDTPEEARIKLAELRALLEDSRNNLMYYGGGASEDVPVEY